MLQREYAFFILEKITINLIPRNYENLSVLGDLDLERRKIEMKHLCCENNNLKYLTMVCYKIGLILSNKQLSFQSSQTIDEG